MYLQIYLTKQDWDNLYRIALVPDYNNARGFVLGVWNNWDKLGQPIDDGQIRAALAGRVRSGNSDERYWSFWMWADPYRNWTDVETLSCFLGAKGEQAISDLSEPMLTMARVTENVIDTIVRDWRDQRSKAVPRPDQDPMA